MNSTNDQRFFDLAMKTISGHCTGTERAELDALVAAHPELKPELEKLRTEARLVREVLPLVEAAESHAGEFPGYARERLQTKVRETLGQTGSPAQRRRWNWRWVLGMAGAAAAVVLLGVVASRPSALVIEVALLDTAGVVRGSETNEMAVFRKRWENAQVRVFDKPADLDTWQTNRYGNNKPVAKVVYDRAAGELRVTLFGVGKTPSRTFAVDRDLASALQEADKFIREQIAR